MTVDHELYMLENRTPPRQAAELGMLSSLAAEARLCKLESCCVCVLQVLSAVDSGAVFGDKSFDEFNLR